MAGSKVREVLWLRKSGEVPKVCAGYGNMLTAGRIASTNSTHLRPLASTEAAHSGYKESQRESSVLRAADCVVRAHA